MAGGVDAAPTSVEGSATASQRAERLTPPTPPPAASATYTVTLAITWDASTHPTTLPPNSHVSPPVVVTHGEVGDLFVRGAAASAGIERMAETGATSQLRFEMANDPTVSSVQTGSSLFGSGERRFEVTVTTEAALASLVTMLAPSPDWFVGVRDVDLFAGGSWADEVTVELRNYDAGTDSGPDFTSPNADTQPAVAIGGPRDAAFVAAAAEGSFGSVTFVRTG